MENHAANTAVQVGFVLTFALVKVLLAIRTMLVGMFHLMWSPVTSEEEMDKHDMSLNARALFMLVTAGIAIAIGVLVS